MTYSTCDTFSTITNISIPVNSSKSNLVFFKAACQANL